MVSDYWWPQIGGDFSSNNNRFSSDTINKWRQTFDEYHHLYQELERATRNITIYL